MTWGRSGTGEAPTDDEDDNPKQKAHSRSRAKSEPPKQDESGATKRTFYEGTVGDKMKMRVPAPIETMTDEQILATSQSYNRLIKTYNADVELIPNHLLTKRRFDAKVLKAELKARIVEFVPEKKIRILQFEQIRIN